MTQPAFTRRDALILGAGAVTALAAPRMARAATKLRVAKANPHAICSRRSMSASPKAFSPASTSHFSGAAKAMVGTIGGAADIYLGGGTDFAFEVKGVPVTGVAAALAGPRPPRCLPVLWDLPIKTLDDMKGKKVQVSTVGSTTDWLVKKLAVVKGCYCRSPCRWAAIDWNQAFEERAAPRRGLRGR